MDDFMKRHQEELEYNVYMNHKINELSHGNSSNCTTEQIIQIASQLDDGERIYCTTDITPNIELTVNISSRLQEDALIMLTWHARNHGLRVTDSPFPGEAKALMLVLGEYPEQRWRVMNGQSGRRARP